MRQAGGARRMAGLGWAGMGLHHSLRPAGNVDVTVGMDGAMLCAILGYAVRCVGQDWATLIVIFGFGCIG